MTEQFAAAPKVVKPKKKYKQQEPEQNQEQQIKLIYNNLMWDKRVFRGNTHAALVTLKNVQNIQQLKQTRKNFQSDQQPVIIEQSTNKRANIEIFTDQFVQNLTDKPPRYDYASQTDTLSQKSVLRHRLLNRQNIANVQTQIWDDELFDFDYEVEPLLNVLCGRILQVSRMEVLQQEELNIMKNRQEELFLQEKAERQKIKKMYDEESKLQLENAKKLEKFRKQKDDKIKTHKRLFSRVLAKNFLTNIHQNAINIVERNGFFRNPLDIKIMNEVPRLYYQNSSKINKEQSDLIDEAFKIAEDARATILKQHALAKQVQRTRRNQIIFKREQLERQKQQRKQMKNQEKQTKEFLIQQKIQKEKDENERKKVDQKQENGEAQGESI